MKSTGDSIRDLFFHPQTLEVTFTAFLKGHLTMSTGLNVAVAH